MYDITIEDTKTVTAKLEIKIRDQERDLRRSEDQEVARFHRSIITDLVKKGLEIRK